MSANPESLSQSEIITPDGNSRTQPSGEERFNEPVPTRLIALVGVAGLALNLFICSIDPTPPISKPKQNLTPTPIPQRILTPLPAGKNICPDGTLPVVTKNNAFCRQ